MKYTPRLEVILKEFNLSIPFFRMIYCICPTTPYREVQILIVSFSGLLHLPLYWELLTSATPEGQGSRALQTGKITSKFSIRRKLCKYGVVRGSTADRRKWLKICKKTMWSWKHSCEVKRGVCGFCGKEC